MGAVWMKQLERTAGYAGFFMYRMYGIAQGARDGGARMYRMYGKHKEPGMAVRVCTGCTDRYKLQNICNSAIRGGRIA